MQGIVLAGGTGTRLWPVTHAVSKQLLPVYDKPMVYYPVATLMSAGIRRILLITRPDELGLFKKLFGDGEHLGLEISYASQPEPNGIAAAFVVAQDWLESTEPVTLILGDNLFHGDIVAESLRAAEDLRGARIFAYEVADPRSYGVVEVSQSGAAISIEEKPNEPKSTFAVPGLYVYDDQVMSLVARLKPSARGEFEITDLNRLYMERDQLQVVVLPRGVAWLDTGTFSDLHDASAYIRAIEARQGVRVGSLEEIAWRQGWISDRDLAGLARQYSNSGYGDYLAALLA